VAWLRGGEGGRGKGGGGKGDGRWMPGQEGRLGQAGGGGRGHAVVTKPELRPMSLIGN
jgi:hypothetical protein